MPRRPQTSNNLTVSASSSLHISETAPRRFTKESTACHAVLGAVRIAVRDAVPGNNTVAGGRAAYSSWGPIEGRADALYSS